MGKKRGKKGVPVQTTQPPPTSTTVVPSVSVADNNSAETHVQPATKFESEVPVPSDTGANVLSVEEETTTIPVQPEGSNLGTKTVQEQILKETDAATDVPHSETTPCEDSLREAMDKQKDEAQPVLAQESKDYTVAQKQDQMQNEKKATGKRGKKKGERKDETEKEEHKQPEMTVMSKNNEDGEMDLFAMNKGGKQEKQKKSNKKRDKKKSEISESEEESHLQEVLGAEEITITSSASKETTSEPEKFQMRTEEMHIQESTSVSVERQPGETVKMKDTKHDGVTEIVQEKSQDEFSEEDDTWCQVTRKGGKKKDKKKGDRKNDSGPQIKEIPQEEEVTHVDEQPPNPEAIKSQQLNQEKGKKGRNKKKSEFKSEAETPPKEDSLKEQDNVVLSSEEPKLKDSLTDMAKFAPFAAEPEKEPEIPPILNVVSETKTLPTSPSETIQVPDIIDALIEVYGNETKLSTPDSAMPNQEPEIQVSPETITTADIQGTVASSTELSASMEPNVTPFTESAPLAAKGNTIDPLIDSAIALPLEFSVPASRKSTSPPPKEATALVSAEPVTSPPSEPAVSTSTDVAAPLPPEPIATLPTEHIMLPSAELAVPVSTGSIATTESIASESILPASAVLSQVTEPILPTSKEPTVSQLTEPSAPQLAETILPFTVESSLFAPAGTTVSQSTDSNVPSGPSTAESTLPTNAEPFVSMSTEPTRLPSAEPIAWPPVDSTAPVTTKFNLLTSADTNISQPIEPALMTEAASGIIQPTANLRDISVSTPQISSEPQVEDMSEGEAIPSVLAFENLELEDDFDIPDLIEEDMESQFSPIDLTQEEEMFRLEEAKQQFESAQELLKGLEIFPPETGVPTEGKIQVQPMSALVPEAEADLKLTQSTESQIHPQITKAKFVPLDPIDPFMEDEVIIDTGIPTENILDILPEPEVNTEHMQMTTEPLAETSESISSQLFMVAEDENKVAPSGVPTEEEPKLLEAVRLPVDIDEMNDSAEVAVGVLLEVEEPQFEFSKKKKKKDNKKEKKSEYTSTKEKREDLDFFMETSDQQQRVEVDAETKKLASEPTEKDMVADIPKDEEKPPIKPIVETVDGNQEELQNQVEVEVKTGDDKLVLDTTHDEEKLPSKSSLEADVGSQAEPVKHMKSDETGQLVTESRKSKKKERNKIERKSNFEEVTEIITEPEKLVQFVLEGQAPADEDEEHKKLTGNETSFESVIEAAAILTTEMDNKEQSESQKNIKYKEKQGGKQRRRKPEEVKGGSETEKSKCEELLENTDINPTPMGEYENINVPTDEVLEKIEISEDKPILTDDTTIKQVEQSVTGKENTWGRKKGKQSKEEKSKQEEEEKKEKLSHDSKCEELLEVIDIIPATLGACTEHIVPTDKVLPSTEISSEDKLTVTSAIDTTQGREGKDKERGKKKGKQSKEEKAKQQEEGNTERQSNYSKCEELPEVTDIMPATLGELSTDEVLQSTEISFDDKPTVTSATDTTQEEGVKKEKKWAKKKGKQSKEEKSKEEEGEKIEKKSHDINCKELPEVIDVKPATLKGLPIDDVLQSTEISESKPTITSAMDSVQEGVKEGKKWGKKQGKQSKEVKARQQEERETERQSHDSKSEELPEVTDVMPATLGELLTDEMLQSKEIASPDKPTMTGATHIKESEVVEKGKKWGKKKGKQWKEEKSKQEEEQNSERQTHDSMCEELPEVIDVMPPTIGELPTDEVLKSMETSSQDKSTLKSAVDIEQEETVVEKEKKWGKKKGKQSKENKDKREAKSEEKPEKSKCEELPVNTDLVPSPLGENNDNIVPSEVLQATESSTQDRPILTCVSDIDQEGKLMEKKGSKKKGKGKQGEKEGKGKPEIVLNESVLKVEVTPKEVPENNESTSPIPKVTEIPDVVADTATKQDVSRASAAGLQEEKCVQKVEKEETLNQKKGKGKGGKKDKKSRSDQVESKPATTADDRKSEEVSTSSEVRFAAGMQGESKQIAQSEGKSITNKEAGKEIPSKEKGKQGGKKGKKGKSEPTEVSQKVKESVSKHTEKSIAVVGDTENAEGKKTETKTMTLSELFEEVLEKKVRGKLHSTGDSTTATDYADTKKQEETKEDKMKENSKKMNDIETRGMKQTAQVSLEKNENLQATNEEDKQVTVKAEEDNKVPSADIKLASEEDDIQLIARPVFIANACHICKVLNENENKLKSCGACKMIAYCGSEHQKQHWQQHKSVCNWVRKQLAKEKKEHLFSEVDGSDFEKWKNVRYKYMIMCEKGIGRKLELYEREMFLYPRVCETCHSSDQDTLKLCMKCHSVNYCSPEHLSKDHSKWCKELRLLLDINTYQSKYGMVDPPLPDKIFETYEELPPTMKEFLVTKVLGPSRSIGLDKVIFNCLTEIASYPLTVLYAMQHISSSAEEKRESGKGDKKKGKKEVEKTEDIKGLDKYESLTIHLVGAEIQFEGDAIAKWDVFILNVIPNLQTLRIVLIGPEVSSDTIAAGVSKEDFRCPHCTTANREFICEFQPNMTYHEYVKSSAYTKPDVIAAFNCGLYRHTGFDGKDSWGPSIPYLIKDPTVPLILTAYTSQESPKDIARIKKQGKVEILLPPQRNPYRSLRPNQTFEDESPVMYRNNYIAVIRGTR